MIRYLLILITVIFSTQILAQNDNQLLLKKLVEKEILTSEEAEEIAQETKKEQVSQDKNFTEKVNSILNPKPYLQLGGYALLHQSYSSTRDIKNQSAIRFAFLSMKGEPIKNLNYFILFSIRHAELTECNVSWKLHDALQFKAGMQKTLIALENQISLVNLEFIQNAKMMDYLIGGGYDAIGIQNGKHNSGRDIGVKMFGELFKQNNHSLIEYAIGMYQGSGINTPAQRSDKDFAANVLISPIEGFRIGGGVYLGEAVYGIEGKLPKQAHVRNRWIASSDLKKDKVSARIEYAYANDAGVNKEGCYGVCSWRFHPKLDFLAKLEYYNDDKTVGREFMDYGTGLNFWFAKMCRIQANYTYTDFSKVWGQKNSHLVEAQLQIVF